MNYFIQLESPAACDEDANEIPFCANTGSKAQCLPCKRPKVLLGEPYRWKLKDFLTGFARNKVVVGALFIVSICLSAIGPGILECTASDSREIDREQRNDYLIGHEDVLEISVWKNAELSKVVTVRPDGMISLPLIGDMPAAGLTPNQLRDEIIEKLKVYQETVMVSVIVQQVNSYRIFILGEVIKPGLYLLKTRTTLLQAISLAGGFNQFASKNKIVVIRSKSKSGSREEKILVRFDDIVNINEISDKNLILRSGDTIFVP